MVRPFVARTGSRYHPVSPAPRGTGLVRSQPAPAKAGGASPRTRGAMTRPDHGGRPAEPTGTYRRRPFGRRLRGDLHRGRSAELSPSSARSCPRQAGYSSPSQPLRSSRRDATRRSSTIIAPRGAEVPSDFGQIRNTRPPPGRTEHPDSGGARGSDSIRRIHAGESATTAAAAPFSWTCRPHPPRSCRPRRRPEIGRDCSSPPPRPVPTGRPPCEESGCHPG